MNTGIFAVEVEKRASPHYDMSHLNPKTVHALMGICGEGGELIDYMKKCVYKNTPMDRDKVIDEMGDVLWYIQLGLNSVNSSLDEAMARNVAKLAARYGEKFSVEAANNINRVAEAEAQKSLNFGEAKFA